MDARVTPTCKVQRVSLRTKRLLSTALLLSITLATAFAFSSISSAKLRTAEPAHSDERGASATVTTDKTDYQPGETVVITGSGWTAGETVRLNIHRESSDGADVALSAVADEYGNILNREFAVRQEHYGSSFTLSATGESSGLTATATFTDGPVMSYTSPTASLSYEASAATDQSDTVQVAVTGAPLAACGGCNGRYDAAASFVPNAGFPASIDVSLNPNSRQFRPTPPAQNNQSYNVVVKVKAGTVPGVYTGRFYAVPDATDPDVINAPGGALTKGAGTQITINVNNSAAPNSSATAITLPDLAPYSNGTFTTKDVRVTLNATDLSGVANLKYQVDGGGYTTVTTLPAVVNITGEGNHTIQFFATDAFGLVESPTKSFNVKIDRTAPSFSNCGPADASWHGADVQYNCTASDNAGGVGLLNASDAGFTLTTDVPANTEDANASTDSKEVCDEVGNCVMAGPITGNMIDKKRPQITASAKKADNSAYSTGSWTNQSVTVSFQCTDGGSGVNNASVTAPVTLGSDGADQSAPGSCSDNVGNTAQTSFDHIFIDKTDPTLSFDSYLPAPNAAGWNKTNVSVAFTPGDALSGVANTSTASPLVLSAEGSAVSGSVTVTDVAGNSKTFTTNAVKIDKTAPQITINTPANNGSYILNSVVAASFTTADALSGIDASTQSSTTANGSNIDTGSVGQKTFTVSVSDVAGNSSSQESKYNVNYLGAGAACGGAGHVILQPINVDGTSVFKKGSTVPAKFRVFDANCNSIGSAGVVTGFVLMYAGSSSNAPVNETVDSTTPDTVFRWSPTDQQWIFNINTKNLTAGQKYFYRVTLNDSSYIDFAFSLK